MAAIRKSGMRSSPWDLSSVTLITLLIVCTFIASGEAIKCWECNSKYDSRCGDTFNNFTTALVDCDMRQDRVEHLDTPEGMEEVPKANICRKSTQTVEGETRVIRGCGWLKNFGDLSDRTCFNRAGTKEVQIYHCVCYEDRCNSAESLSVSLFVMLLIPALPGLFH